MTVCSTDILDTMIEGGYTPSSFDGGLSLSYIDHGRKTCCALGALAIRADIEPARVPSCWHGGAFVIDPHDLRRRLASYYQVSREFLEGVEAGFEDWDMDPALRRGGDYCQGYHAGRTALHHFLRPPYERSGMIIA